MNLLISSVGGAPEPVAASLLHWRPARAIFVVTAQTRSYVTDSILPKLTEAGWADFDAGRYDLHELTDAQDFNGIIDQLRKLDDQVANWQSKSGQVIVDFTGGTKPMSAALAAAAMRWPCQISYVGGIERSKDGVGIVLSGKEQIVHTQNPADTLGLLALDTALKLMRSHAFAAAQATLKESLHLITAPARKAELTAVMTLVDALADWDRFQHQTAFNKLRDFDKHTHNLHAALGQSATQTLIRDVTKLQTHLQAIIADPADSPSSAKIHDLLANAKRRMDEQRWDDAVARLYRAIEAIAQERLASQHSIPDTGNVPISELPESLQTEWASRAEAGNLKLGLQDSYYLLQIFDDRIGTEFANANLADKQKSPLTARNQSILAHGHQPVSEKTAQALFDAALKLAGLSREALIRPPELPTINSTKK
jgi:CRISPR-associated protein (TIGR02710 family)